MGWSGRWGDDTGAWWGLEGGGDGEIMAYVEDTAREGDILCTVLSLTSMYLGSEVLELDRLWNPTWFVEAIHYYEVWWWGL
jgi:hypothetical protein